MNGAGQAGRSAAEVESLVVSFRGVTSASREEALFFLESCDWELEPAIEAFVEDQPPEGDEENTEEDGGGEEREGEEAASDDENYVPSDEEAGNPAMAPPPVAVRVNGSGSRGKEKAGKTSSRSGIATFSDLKKRKAESDSDSDTDSDEEQDYYAGAGKSGMPVRDSSIKRNRKEAIIGQARKFVRPGVPKSISKSFTGRGRVLSSEAPSAGTQQEENTSYNIYFWTNGFTVNNGPLRRLDDPNNAAFLESIKKSECPEELKPSDGSSEVHVDLIHMPMHYSTPRSIPQLKRSLRKGRFFRGNGRTLGSDPVLVPDTTADVPAPVPTSASNPRPSTNPGFQVDESLPTTSLQIRLADGTRFVSRFNTSHTISDLRAFIDASRPSGTGTNGSYRLQTVEFPARLLDDVNKTIEEEGIANSVVIQKF